MSVKFTRLVGFCLAASLLAACTGESDVEKVEAQNTAMRNSPKLEGYPAGANTAAVADKFCYWNDKKYSDGASVCDNRIRYKCWGEKWVEVGQCPG